MSRGIISYGSLAAQLKKEIEQELNKEVRHHAIVMALRRHGETLKQQHQNITFDYSTEIILKTNICDIAVQKSPTLFSRLKQLYDIVNFEKGDVVNVIHGRYEVSIVTNERYLTNALNYLAPEKILNIEKDLITLTLTFPKEFLYTPGITFNVVRSIAWENINIYEIVSTNTELTLVLHKKDAIEAYTALEILIQNNPSSTTKNNAMRT
jgi:aspartokinase